jgi:CRISPR-associated protein Csm1
MTHEEQTVVLSALLQGLEEYLLSQRAAIAGTGAPPSDISLLTASNQFSRCVDVNLLRALLGADATQENVPETATIDELNDQRTAALRSLVHQSRHLAASDSESGVTETQTSSAGGGLLSPIFDHLELLQPYAPARRYLVPQALTSTEKMPPFFAQPAEEIRQHDSTTHTRALIRQFERLRVQLDWQNFDCVYTHLLNLLQTYAWCIPAATRSNAQDVSLYDHARVASAIAACLYKYHDAQGPLGSEAVNEVGQTRCLLLAGNLSGIQRYIFGISTTGAGGVAKRLRARSFFVQLFSDTASLRVIRAFNLPLANILMASGGKFYVLLPNLPDAVTNLQTLQREFDDWALKEFHGELALNLAWTEMTDRDFAAGEYGQVLTRLHSALQERSARRLADALQADGRWRQEFAREIFAGDIDCLSCHRFPATKLSQDRTPEEGPDICEQCDNQLQLGRRLTKSRYVSFHQGNDGHVSCLGVSISLGQTPRAGAFLAVHLNDPELRDASHLPATFRYLANHVPRDDKGDPLSFEEIAGESGLLGVLKADVDNLGQVIQEGFRRDPPERGFDTVSRLVGLSRQLDWFFSGWLESLLGSKYEQCYTVYSGGDDLLIVGPRALTLDLAQEIKREFERYTQHPEITLSAGLAVVKQRLPLAHTVRQADTALQQAKEAGRDRLCVLGQTLQWDEVAPLFKEVSDLAGCEARSSFLYHVLLYADLWQRFKRDDDLQGLRYHSLLAYDIGRNVSIRDKPELHQWARRLLRFPPRGEVEQLLNHLKLISQWVLLERRKQNG